MHSIFVKQSLWFQQSLDPFLLKFLLFVISTIKLNRNNLIKKLLKKETNVIGKKKKRLKIVIYYTAI